tara:strand:+ start:193 stop:534 length:342 start_codon:yes stop_codon:yes gene_type:complete
MDELYEMLKGDESIDFSDVVGNLSSMRGSVSREALLGRLRNGINGYEKLLNYLGEHPDVSVDEVLGTIKRYFFDTKIAEATKQFPMEYVGEVNEARRDGTEEETNIDRGVETN